MDELVEKLVALGVPGLVLIVAVSATGYAGAVAITTALAALGGPLGMMGGIAALGLLSLISHKIAEKGFETVFKAVLNRLYEEGHTEEELHKKIDSYPITKKLKLKLHDYINLHTPKGKE